MSSTAPTRRLSRRSTQTFWKVSWTAAILSGVRCTPEIRRASWPSDRATPYSPPEWPDGTPQQLHLDLTVADLRAAGLRAVELGAVVLTDPVEEPGSTFVVYADPAGHPFCLCEDRLTGS